jgi:hypothetical protein
MILSCKEIRGCAYFISRLCIHTTVNESSCLHAHSTWMP